MHEGRKPAGTIEGLVTSAKSQKTITVELEHMELHPKYKKYIRKTIRFKAHDEKAEAKEGDLVRISQARPISSTKRWRLIQVVTRAKR